jgi:predicted tellurium resistance membrane protein TerC
MITAVVISVGIMLWAAGGISSFVDRHPTIKMLALAFLLLIGVTLVAEGLHNHIPKGYIYFAMAFSVFVEMLNLAARRKRRAPEPIHLRPSYVKDEPAGPNVLPIARRGEAGRPSKRTGRRRR